MLKRLVFLYSISLFSLLHLAGDEKVTFSDQTLQAYIQGVVDVKFSKNAITVTCKNNEVYLSNLPSDEVKATEIISFIKDFTSINSVSKLPNQTIATSEKFEAQEIPKKMLDTWFPDSLLFPTQIANPRQIYFSVGHRFHDRCCGQNASTATFGDYFPIYRWYDIGKWRGAMQLDIEGGVFAVFNQDHGAAPLYNADYYVGIPLSYRVGPWAFRARLYHISSHLGDEYMRMHKHAKRYNKSFEAIDIFTAYDYSSSLRFYGGLGAIVESDKEMRQKPFYAEYGIEARPFRKNFETLYGTPFLAMHFRNMQQYNYKYDATYALGYEWGKIDGTGQRLRIFLEYHDGYSLDGQFSNKRNNYYALRMAYGF